MDKNTKEKYENQLLDVLKDIQLTEEVLKVTKDRTDRDIMIAYLSMLGLKAINVAKEVAIILMDEE